MEVDKEVCFLVHCVLLTRWSKRVAPTLARRAFTVGKGVVKDVLGGKWVEASFKRRAKEARVGLLSDMENSVFHFNPSYKKCSKKVKKKKKSATLTLHSGLGSVLQIVYIVLVHTVQVLIWIDKVVQNRHVQS